MGVIPHFPPNVWKPADSVTFEKTWENVCFYQWQTVRQSNPRIKRSIEELDNPIMSQRTLLVHTFVLRDWIFLPKVVKDSCHRLSKIPLQHVFVGLSTLLSGKIKNML